MAVVAVIPARGGSKGIPGKNLERVGGQTLVARAVAACSRAALIDVVVVSSDDDRILVEAARRGATPIRRPGHLATDEATTEAALLHALDEIERSGTRADIIVLVQCTSPFIDHDALDRSITRVAHRDADVVFSAVPTHEFVWRRTAEGVDGVNHSPASRPRRQDRDVEYRETGAFYVMDRAGFMAAGHRFFGRIDVELVRRGHEIEIDEPADLAEARWRATATHTGWSQDPIGPVDVLVTDFDGVHTDNTVTVDEFGNESVRANRADGLGIAAVRRRGVHVLVLSTEVNPVVRHRAAKLGVECINGCDDKRSTLLAWLAERGLDASRTVFVGNDRNDAECLELVGWPVVVADAHPSVMPLARVVTGRRGGDGAVREVCDHILAGIEQRTDRTFRSPIGTEVLHG